MRITLLHGFSQTARCWGPLDAALSAAHGPRPIDLPGHGNRTLEPVPADLWGAADEVASSMSRGALLGYSLGGRVALHVALAHPERVTALILVSATAGIRDPAERADRRAADDRLADRIEADGVGPFLDDWLAGPLFAGLSERYAFRDRRLANSAAGLAASLRHQGTGTQEPLWDRLAELTMPTLVVTGADDAKFTRLGAEMAASIGPAATHVVVPGAGHTTHLESPGPTAAAILSFLDSARR